MGGDVPLRPNRRRRIGSETASAHRDPCGSARPSHVMSKVDYAVYAAAAARLALRLRPNVVYASDPLGAGPGLLAARLAGAALVYHEHDSPSARGAASHPGAVTRAAARAAQLIVFPNEERAHFAQRELRFSDNKLHIVWNVPRRAELVASAATAEPPLIVYYHGSITPERLPETVALAVRRMAGRVRLRIAGYEAPSAGYVRHLIGSDTGASAGAPIEYLGMVPSRADLLGEAARAHVGLSLMPFNSDDLKSIIWRAPRTNHSTIWRRDSHCSSPTFPIGPDVRRAGVRACMRSRRCQFNIGGVGLVRRSSRGAPSHGRPRAEQD